MESSLGKKALSGAAWKFAERIMAQGVTTVVGIVLARILDPEHYGLIAIVNIFITICNVFVVTGLGEALIQKKDADDLDFSSIFYLNIGISILLYAGLYIAAPFITEFYGDGYEQLTAVLRVMGLRLILAAINSIQHAKIARELAFKKYFWVTLTGTMVSAVVGISMALMGYGVWALVGQYMTNTTIDTIMLFVFVRWVPRLQFSFNRTKGLAQYGVRLLIVSVVTTFLDELENLIIGKKYSSADLAYYSKANAYPRLLSNNLSTAISSTLFPVFTKVQGNVEETRGIMSKALKLISFLTFPVLIGLALVADDFVTVLLTEKWSFCVPYMRIFCVYYLLNPLIMTNSQYLTASGDSKTYMKLTFTVRAMGLATLCITVHFGIFWIAIGRLMLTLIEYTIKTIPTYRRIQYGALSQIKDMWSSIKGCLVMTIAVLVIKTITSNSNCVISLLLQILTGGIAYISYALIFQRNYIQNLFNMIKKSSK